MSVITLSEDGFFPAGEHEALYQHLTGDGTNAGLIRIISPEAVHDLHVAQPEAVAPYILDALMPQPYMAAAACVPE
jgi:homoserine acetyltransferase